MSLYIAFIDLTKAFDLVSRERLFSLLVKVGCPPKLLSMFRSSYDSMKVTVQYEGNMSEPFDTKSGMKQGCILAPTLSGILSSLLLKHILGTATEGLYLDTRSDGRLFNFARLRAKTKVYEITIKDLLFADDTAVTTHTVQELQILMDRFSQACKDLGPTISQRKTNMLAQGVETPPVITIDNHKLGNVHQFTYLGSTITNNLTLDAEVNQHIGKAATTLGRLTTQVWENPKLSITTKMAVYIACIINALLCGSEAWTTYAKQEQRLNSFHIHCLHCILDIKWSDKVPNTEDIACAGLPMMYTAQTVKVVLAQPC